MPLHPQWIDVQLVGGPRDGDKLMVHRDRKLLMADDKPDDDSMEDHVVAHAYLPRGDGKHFDYAGKKSRHELNALIRGGALHLPDPDDCGDADWWKQ